ncbi:hypothetical protein [Nocardia sp. NPDC052112]|uniref:hypothetical protein n=1 Tax=Nocardia sp. NPDC052112 TaxID=3155646 RepID=UPI0034273244
MVKMDMRQWNIRWSYSHATDPDDEYLVAYGAIAVLPGTSPRLLVTEEWGSPRVGWLRGDNTFLYEPETGAEGEYLIMFEYPIETPRIELVSGVGGTAALLNSSYGVRSHVFGRGNEIAAGFGPDRPALDFTVGTIDDRRVLMRADGDDDPSLTAYDLITGEQVINQWSPLQLEDHEGPWRLGRGHGRPRVAEVFENRIQLYGSDGYIESLIDMLDACACCLPIVLVFDDAAGPSLVVSREHAGAVWCYGASATSAPDADFVPFSGPIADYPGKVVGARLGRWRDVPVLALRTDVGISLWDLESDEWVCHIPVPARVHDIAFGRDGTLAAIAETGPLLIDIT